MPERFECTTLAKKAPYKYSSFPFLYQRQALKKNLGGDLTMIVFIMRNEPFQVTQKLKFFLIH